MIIVRLKGGLGNQMFQYALGRILALKNNTELKLDTTFFNLNLKNVTKRSYDLDVFNIKAEITQSSNLVWVLRKILKSKGQEQSFDFDASVLNIGENAYLDGYWQSPKYFIGYEDIIKKDFTLKNSPSQNIQDLAREIENTDSLCIHVRRGDYVGNSFHEMVGKEYYEKGIEFIKNHTQIEKIYVFSDDINWCKDNLKFEFPTMFVDSGYAGEKGEGHMFLMSKCKNFIIANSSFSWWGAWLSNKKGKIVICPKQWFSDTTIDTNDLIPLDWVKI